MKFNLFIASVLVSQSLGFRMLRRANDWKERGLSGMERLNQIRLQREGKNDGQMPIRNSLLPNDIEISLISYHCSISFIWERRLVLSGIILLASYYKLICIATVTGAGSMLMTNDEGSLSW